MCIGYNHTDLFSSSLTTATKRKNERTKEKTRISNWIKLIWSLWVDINILRIWALWSTYQTTCIEVSSHSQHSKIFDISFSYRTVTDYSICLHIFSLLYSLFFLDFPKKNLYSFDVQYCQYIIVYHILHNHLCGIGPTFIITDKYKTFILYSLKDIDYLWFISSNITPKFMCW